MWIEVTAPHSFPPSHTDHIVLFANHIAGSAMSFEVGTLVGGPGVMVGEVGGRQFLARH